MSFRRNKQQGEEDRRWNAICQTNWELIEGICLSLAAVETLDRFNYLLMHGSMYPYNHSSGFDILELREAAPEKFELFKAFVDKYFEAGFHNPGIHPAYIGGDAQYLRLVRNYPGQFSVLARKLLSDQQTGMSK